MANEDEEDTRQYAVVVNDEEQYSISLADGELASGWRHAGRSGTKVECLKYIDQVWNDMRPLTVRRKWHVMPISGRTEEGLKLASENIRARLEDDPDLSLVDVVYTLQVDHTRFAHRRAVICTDSADAVEALHAKDASRVLTRETTTDQSTVAFMFAGQGTQFVGMGGELYRTERVYREQVDQCLERLDVALGSELRWLLFTKASPSPNQSIRLRATELAQPALFIIEYALSRLLESWGVHPDILIGHSIGEYVAACLAHVFSLDDALRLVAARGRMMQSMAVGKMLSIACTPAQLHDLLPPDIDLAAVNGSRQCVVAGAADAIALLERDLLARGIAALPLRTSHAFHSRMMEPMLKPFAQELARTAFHVPAIPCVSNVTGSLAASQLLADSGYWLRHIRQPVMFAAGVHSLLEFGARLLVEIGPGKTLSSLARQRGAEDRGATIVDVMPDGAAQPSEAFWIARALAKMWLAGSVVDWPSFYSAESHDAAASASTNSSLGRRSWSA